MSAYVVSIAAGIPLYVHRTKYLGYLLNFGGVRPPFFFADTFEGL